MQGKAYGKLLLARIEARARDLGYFAIRLDSFCRTEASNRLYLTNGFSLAGSVFFEGKPEGNEEYFCYEKLLALL